jgi:D-serine deaminase-like pyridoxal phosphate-dependent protein
MDLRQLETPCLVLDKGKLERNIAGLHRRLARHGVGLRPHGKTPKNIDALEMALAGQPGGITVSTLKEAEYYFGHGIGDIVYAVGIAPVKLDRIAGLVKKGARVTLILDTIAQVEFVATKARETGVTLPVRIEPDCDGHRSGVADDDPLLLEIGRRIDAAEGLVLDGVLTHASGAYDCTAADAIGAAAGGV